ncbi:alkaline phosphatase family protein [Oleiharenicola lentus]|uniref:alkaline phosphatase family protein n=1 Tax=Oleiharenicola lentus TaxID=2508720 RepID=UPI003F675C3C
MKILPNCCLRSAAAGLILLAMSASPLKLSAVNRDAVVIVVSIDGLPSDYFEAPSVAMPTLRALAARGARAEGMVSVFPTVTWPNHTSMVTGVSPAKHGVLGNIYYDRAKKAEVNFIWDPIFDKEDMVKVPTVYDVAHLAGLKTAGIAWPGSRNAKHLDWQVPCVIEADLLERYTTPEVKDLFRTLGISLQRKTEWGEIDVGGKALWDWMHTQVASQLVQRHRPNLLLIHFDMVDALQHRNGRNRPEADWAVNLADHYLRELVAATEAAGLAERATFIVVSDHGFFNYSKQINGNAVLREAGLIKTAGNRIVESRAHFLSMTGGAAIYITDVEHREQMARDLAARFKSIEGVAEVLDAGAIKKIGLATAAEDARAPDLMLSAAEGYGFSPRIPSLEIMAEMSQVKGAHGYLPDQPKMYATFVASGAGIKAGVKLGKIRNVDVAPTIAALLGLEMKNVEGRVLHEILK